MRSLSGEGVDEEIAVEVAEDVPLHNSIQRLRCNRGFNSLPFACQMYTCQV